MRREYDFSDAMSNPYIDKLRDSARGGNPVPAAKAGLPVRVVGVIKRNRKMEKTAG